MAGLASQGGWCPSHVGALGLKGLWMMGSEPLAFSRGGTRGSPLFLQKGLMAGGGSSVSGSRGQGRKQPVPAVPWLTVQGAGPSVSALCGGALACSSSLNPEYFCWEPLWVPFRPLERTVPSFPMGKDGPIHSKASKKCPVGSVLALWVALCRRTWKGKLSPTVTRSLKAVRRQKHIPRCPQPPLTGRCMWQ